MRPLKPIKQAQHNSSRVSSADAIGKMIPIEPIPDTKGMPILVETVEESFKRVENAKPIEELACFGKLCFRSSALYLISNDGWKGHTLDVSMRLAHHFAYVKKRKTLYVNCIVDRISLGRKFKALVGKKHIPNGLLQLATSAHGEVGSGLSTLIDAIQKQKIEVVMLNSWEWGAFSTTKKRKLFQVFDWLTELTNVAIVIFTSAKAESISVGNFRKGRLGLLADIADAVIDLRAPNALLPTLYNDDLAIPSDEVKPVYMTKPDEKKHEGEQVVSIEINSLEEVMGTPHVSNGQLVPA
jgi:hypothetical protein